MKKIILSLLLAVGFMFQGCTQGEDGSASIQYKWDYYGPVSGTLTTTDPAFPVGTTIYSGTSVATQPGTYYLSYQESYDSWWWDITYTIYINKADGMDDGADVDFQIYFDYYWGPYFHDYIAYAKGLIPAKSETLDTDTVNLVSVKNDGPIVDYSKINFGTPQTITRGKYTIEWSAVKRQK